MVPLSLNNGARWFASAVLAVTMLVILWGAYVRVTGSGAGCGAHWPTCNGTLIANVKTRATAIEFTHRATSGFSLLLVFAQALFILKRVKAPHKVRKAAVASMLFMLSEAAVGAALVLLEMVASNASLARGGWMVLHLGNTFFLIATLALIVEWTGTEQTTSRLNLSAGKPWFIGMTLMLIASAGGALSALGDTLFPVASLAQGWAQDFSAFSHLFLRLRLLHPAFAILCAGYLTYQVAKRKRHANPPAAQAMRWLMVCVHTQVLCGVINWLLLAPAWMQLVHLLIADLAWLSLVVLTARVSWTDKGYTPPHRAT